MPGKRLRWLAVFALLLLGAFLGACTGGSDDAVPAACVDANNRLNGTWFEASRTSAVLFPDTFVFRKVGPESGTLQGLGGTLAYAFSTECDAILVTDAADRLVVTYGYRFTNDWLALSNWNRTHYYWNQARGGTGGTSLTCPASTTAKYLLPRTLEQSQAEQGNTLRTGSGAYAAMGVEPAGWNWNGRVIGPESVEFLGESCGLGAAAAVFCGCKDDQGRIVACSATFQVGAKFSGSPPGVAEAEPNTFWDVHFAESTTESLLHDRVPLSSCAVQCRQTYRCGGDVIGTHVVRYLFTRDNAATVTRVTVEKN